MEEKKVVVELTELEASKVQACILLIEKSYEIHAVRAEGEELEQLQETIDFYDNLAKKFQR